jgi:hypothetical protein
VVAATYHTLKPNIKNKGFQAFRRALVQMMISWVIHARLHVDAHILAGCTAGVFSVTSLVSRRF